MKSEQIDPQETKHELFAQMIPKEKIELLVRSAALNKPISPEIAMDIAKLVFTTAALSAGEATLNVTFKIHDTDDASGQLRRHGLHGFCLACIKIESKIGHICASIAPGEMTRCCLLPFTEVSLRDGSKTTVDKLNVNDFIMAFDKSMRQTVPTKVTFLMKNHVREGYYIVNNDLFITNDHPILVMQNGDFKWLNIEDLKQGDFVCSAQGHTLVNTLERIDKKTETVYLETEIGNLLIETANNSYIIQANYAKLDIKDLFEEIEILSIADIYG